MQPILAAMLFGLLPAVTGCAKPPPNQAQAIRLHPVAPAPGPHPAVVDHAKPQAPVRETKTCSVAPIDATAVASRDKEALFRAFTAEESGTGQSRAAGPALASATACHSKF